MAFDSSKQTTGSYGGSVTALTYSGFTMGAGANGMMLVSVFSNATANPVSGITWNGAAMTLLQASIKGVGGNPFTQIVYGLPAPASGNNNLVVTWNGNIAYRTYDLTVYSETGNLQSVPTNVAVGLVPEVGGTVSLPITTVVNNAWAVLFVYDNFATTSVTFATGTKRQQLASSASTADSGAPVTPAGTYTFVVNGSNSDSWQYVAVELPPAAASGHLFRNPALDGLGGAGQLDLNPSL